MTKEEIIEMAMEAEFVSRGKPSEEESELFVCIDKDIYKLANLVAAKEREACIAHAMTSAEKAIDVAIKLEREACAKVADGWPDYDVQGLAEAIRARGQA